MKPFTSLFLLVVAPWNVSFAQGEHYMRAHYIDVGQGNSTLLEFPCKAVLIDSGGKDETSDGHLRAYLDKFFERRKDLDRTLDVVFITHTHIDHNRALRSLVEGTPPRFKVLRYVHNGILTGSGRHAANFMSENLSSFGIAGREIRVSAMTGKKGMTDSTIDPVSCTGIDPVIRVLSGQMDIEVDWPGDALENGNNHSLVVRVDFGKVSFLFTGDLEVEGIETLMERYAGTSMLDVDVYEVGHHGSHNGTTPELLATMSPRVAVISMSPSTDQRAHTAWAYGHPREIVINSLIAAVARNRTHKTVRVARAMKKFKNVSITKAIFATGWDENVVVYARSDGAITVRTFPKQ